VLGGVVGHSYRVLVGVVALIIGIASASDIANPRRRPDRRLPGLRDRRENARGGKLR